MALYFRRSGKNRQCLSQYATIALPLAIGDSPDFDPFNGDPARLAKAIVNPGRIRLLAPGEPFEDKRLKNRD